MGSEMCIRDSVTFVDVLKVNYDEDGEIEDTDIIDRENVIEFWIES